MVAFLIVALFVATAFAVVVALADSAIRGRNAWQAIRREMAASHAIAVPVNDGVVVQMRPAASPYRASSAQRPVALKQTPRSVAA